MVLTQLSDYVRSFNSQFLMTSSTCVLFEYCEPAESVCRFNINKITRTSCAIILIVRARDQIDYILDILHVFLSTKWAYLHQLCGGSHFILYVFGIHAVHLISYFVANLPFVVMDLTGRPQYFKKYKIQEGKNTPVDWEAYIKCVKVTLINVTVFGFITVLGTWPIAYWVGMPIDHQLPSLKQGFSAFLVYVLAEEIVFYYLHRLFHHRFLYSRFHKIHHEWKAPVSVAQVYCHPFEHVFLNCLPLACGPLLLGSYRGNHLIVGMMWNSLVVMASANVHSGYHLPFTNSAEEHDFHHSRFNQNFGTIGLLDYLHGTDGAFRQSKSYQRHFVLFSSKSAKELVPD